MITPQVRDALQELIDEGLIAWTGEYRDGQRVYRITPKGRIRAVQA